MQLERKMIIDVEGGTWSECMSILRHEAGTPISCSAVVDGRSCSAGPRNAIHAIIDRIRPAGILSNTCGSGTRRAIRMKISPKRLRCGFGPARIRDRVTLDGQH